MPMPSLEMYKSAKAQNLETHNFSFCKMLRFTSSLVLVNRDVVKSINRNKNNKKNKTDISTHYGLSFSPALQLEH